MKEIKNQQIKESNKLSSLTFKDIIDTAYLSLILGVIVSGVYSYITL